jgi:hypothetical protein
LAVPDTDPNIASDVLEKTNAGFVEASPPRAFRGGEGTLFQPAPQLGR